LKKKGELQRACSRKRANNFKKEGGNRRGGKALDIRKGGNLEATGVMKKGDWTQAGSEPGWA